MANVTVATQHWLANSRPQWNALVEKMTFPSIFCTWEWTTGWLEHFLRDSDNPLVLLIHDDSTLVGILPLFSYTAVCEEMWLCGKVLRFCGSRELYPDQIDIICEPEQAPVCVDAVFRFLAQRRDAWDVLRFDTVCADSALARSSALQNDYYNEAYAVSAAPYISLSGTFDEYLGRFDGKQRYNLHSRIKKLSQLGVQYRRAEDHAGALEELFALHERRASDKNIASTFSGAKVRDFHRNLLERLNGTDLAEIVLLAAGNSSIAAAYNFKIGRRVFSYQNGFDPAWNRYAPGMALTYELVKEAFEKGNREYNFLQGREPYKAVWATDQRLLYNVQIYNDSAMGRLSRNAFLATRRAKSFVRPILKWGRR